MRTFTKAEVRREAWQTAIRDAATIGATHRHYGDTPLTDEQLWSRSRVIYNCQIRRARVGVTHLPERVLPKLLASLRKAYDESRERPLVNLERLADMLEADGHPKAYVEQTGGGCATLYVGPTWKDERGDERWTLAIGPGWFDGPGWRQGYASPEELYVGRDDDGATVTHTVPPGATLADIVELVRSAAVVAVAQTAVERHTRKVKAEVLQRTAAEASSRVRWVRPATDIECELLADEIEPEAVGGYADWRVAVYVYHLPRALTFDTVTIPPGTYMRLVEGKTVHGWKVEDLEDAKAYAAAVEEEYERGTRILTGAARRSPDRSRAVRAGA